MNVSPLTPISVKAPGFNGLNLQDSPVTMPPEFSLVAYNAVIDDSGRIAPRKGWTPLNDGANGDLGSNPVTCIHEYINKAGTKQIMCVGNKSIFTLSGSTLTTVYTDGTWTAADWKAVNFNGYAYFFQRGHDPLRWDGTTLIKVNAAVGYLGTVPLAHEVLSAYGRLWVVDTAADKVTITWSDTLIGEAWTGGASGSLDISSILANSGVRPVTALAAFNGQLYVFCDRAILIFSGAAYAPASNLSLVEVINGVGAIGRDAVALTGNDIYFASDTGVRSMGRLVQEKSAPMFDISKNIRDYMNSLVKINADDSKVHAVFSDYYGMFLVSLENIVDTSTFYFDMKAALPDGSRKACIWSLNPYCYATDSQRRLLMGFDGYIGQYDGYDDNTVQYRFKYATTWLDGGDTSRYKILKNLLAIMIGSGNNDILFKWAVDYNTTYSTRVKALPNLGSDEYNDAEYAIGEYSGEAFKVWKINLPLSKYGRVFQIHIEFDVVGPLSIQQLDIFVKPGRTSLQ